MTSSDDAFHASATPYRAAGSLQGRTILMSGGSRGIGLAIALRAARDGANVVLLAKTGQPHAKLQGTVFSALTILSDPGNPLTVPSQQHEGLAMDSNGFLYVVSENGGGDFDHPQLWVYAPSLVPNQAPTALTLTDQVNTLPENTSTVARLKVASVVITDDGLGTNNLTVTGGDPSLSAIDRI